MKGAPFEPSSDRAEIAAGWVERLTAGTPTEADIAALRAWVDADPCNRQAYETARSAWIALPMSNLRRRRVSYARWGGALAASVAGLMMFMPVSHDYQTERGQVTQVRLPDGTIAWLDGSSAIDVDMKGPQRLVSVAGGRVAFKVAKNARPFAVTVGGAIVTDIGTEFVVDDDKSLQVAVSEGEVEVANGDERTRLTAGEGAEFNGDQSLPLGKVADLFAWREGRIVLDDVPLGEALRELDRYYPGTIQLADNELASRRVSGTLFIANPEEGLETIARSQHLKVSHFLWITRVSPDAN